MESLQPQPPVSHPMLDVAIAATCRGDEVLRSRFQTAVRIDSKGTANFVTQADLESESAIVETIRRAFPAHAIISEESHSDRADSSDLWIIDPLDGTSNFMHGIPHFAISIAYYKYGQAELGIVCNPVSRDWYITVRNQGAWHNGKAQKVSSETSLDQTMIVCGFYYDRDRMMQATLDTLGDFFRRNIHGMRRFGAAALDLCHVGCGNYGLFFEYKLHPWDFAAGQLFVTEAGGRVSDCNGEHLPLHRASSICATNASLHGEALEVIAPHWSKLAR
ncbi:MAG: inositol monophosphatase family protein [Pirellula sp.]